jgi:hypothetical protein
MLDQKEIDAMKKVMANLSKVEAQSLGTYAKKELLPGVSTVTESRKFTDPNVHAMQDVLTRLSSVTNSTKRQINEEVKTNTKIRQFTEMEQKGSSVKLEKYEITIREEQFGTTLKNVYDITNIKTGKQLYTGLALFESVMIITKHLLKSGESNTFLVCDKIVGFDNQYARYLTEASMCKAKMKRASTADQQGIYESKYTRAIDQAKAVKSHILKG